VSLKVDHTDEDAGFHWTAATLVLSVFLFIVAGFAEVGGGWLVWQAIREGRPWWWAVIGSLVLILYGFVPTLQPVSDFGRIYAVYGGFFILLCYGWGWLLDGMKPDAGKYSPRYLNTLGLSCFSSLPYTLSGWHPCFPSSPMAILNASDLHVDAVGACNYFL